MAAGRPLQPRRAVAVLAAAVQVGQAAALLDVGERHPGHALRGQHLAGHVGVAEMFEKAWLAAGMARTVKRVTSTVAAGARRGRRNNFSTAFRRAWRPRFGQGHRTTNNTSNCIAIRAEVNRRRRPGGGRARMLRTSVLCGTNVQPSREVPMSTRAYAAPSATSPLGPLTITRREPLAGDVEIDILYCGVCHSDLHFARNEWGMTTLPARARARDPRPRHARRRRGHASSRSATPPPSGCLVDSCRTCSSCEGGLEQFCLQRPGLHLRRRPTSTRAARPTAATRRRSSATRRSR